MIIDNNFKMPIDNFKIFVKNGRFLIKQKKENRLITYDGKPFTFKTWDEAITMTKAIINNNKHEIVNLGYYASKIK